MIRQRRGFVVVADGKIMHASIDQRWGKETLWFGSRGTIFNTRDEARSAIARTKTFRIRHGYEWPWMDNARIVSVEA